MLFETTAYEGGDTIEKRIKTLCTQVPGKEIADLAVLARNKYNLRHVSLLLLVELLKKKDFKEKAATIYEVVNRADELAELLALYWKDGKKPIAAQLKKGLAKAFTKFSAYALAKYNRDAAIKLRDVLFMVHAKPKDKQQEQDWKNLVDGTLPLPNTWENRLSAGENKKKVFTELIEKNDLGYLALLRNLRNMQEVGVDNTVMRQAILARKNGAEKVLPFRYVAAARTCPAMAPYLNVSMLKTIDNQEPLTGITVTLVDMSGSMNARISAKSDLSRADAAASLACMIKGVNRVFAFANNVREVSAYRGLPGIEAIKNATRGGTRLFDAIDLINRTVKYDRIIIITDEQDTGGTIKKMPAPLSNKAYIINVAPYTTGVGYDNWIHINGFSENVLEWLYSYESMYKL
jgi:hypothetical protein